MNLFNDVGQKSRGLHGSGLVHELDNVKGFVEEITDDFSQDDEKRGQGERKAEGRKV